MTSIRATVASLLLVFAGIFVLLAGPDGGGGTEDRSTTGTTITGTTEVGTTTTAPTVEDGTGR